MPYGKVGGMERLAFNFYSNLKAKGHYVIAVKIIQQKTDIIFFNEDEIALSNKDFHEMSFLNRFWFYIKIPFKIRQIIRKNKISHSVSFGDMANIFSSLTFTKEYKIASIHALKSIEFMNKNVLNFLFKFGYKSSYFFFNKVICISHAIKKDIIQNCDFKFIKKLQVIYNPHDLIKINEKSKEEIIANYEKSLFMNDIILFVGRLSIQKAPWHLIKSFSLLENKENNIKLVFIGEGDIQITNYLLELSKELKIEKNVVFLGPKSNPYKYILNSKLVALTSYYEGTPNVIVEAIALGIPIVSSNCTDGISEIMSINVNKIDNINKLIITECGIITPSFYSGHLTLPTDNKISCNEKYYAKALLQILTNSGFKKKLSKNKLKLLKKFDMDTIIKSYFEDS